MHTCKVLGIGQKRFCELLSHTFTSVHNLLVFSLLWCLFEPIQILSHVIWLMRGGFSISKQCAYHNSDPPMK